MVLVAVAVGVACFLVDESEREKLWEQLGTTRPSPIILGNLISNYPRVCAHRPVDIFVVQETLAAVIQTQLNIQTAFSFTGSIAAVAQIERRSLFALATRAEAASARDRCVRCLRNAPTPAAVAGRGNFFP